jgi:hypothetical protein
MGFGQHFAADKIHVVHVQFPVRQKRTTSEKSGWKSEMEPFRNKLKGIRMASANGL